MKKYPSQEYLKSILDYNPETGIFTWKPRKLEMFKTERAFKTWNSRFSGVKAGSVHYPCGVDSVSYIVIRIKNKSLKAHRLAFLYMDGSIPCEIDHDDGCGTNNKWLNINPSNRVHNSRNLGISRRNKSGTTGVTWDKKLNKWHAKIINKHIGYFADIEDAKRARKSAEVLMGFNKNHGEKRR